MSYRVSHQVFNGQDTWWVSGSMIRLIGAWDMSAEMPYDHDPECVSCYLGYAHSYEYHQANMENWPHSD